MAGKTLLDLPPEIRNIIYQYTLKLPEDSTILMSSGKEHPLLTTCRQVREEASQIYYAINDLEFHISPDRIRDRAAPVYGWAYYRIGRNTLEVGQRITVTTDQFTLRLRQVDKEGMLGLVLDELLFKKTRDYRLVRDASGRRTLEEGRFVMDGPANVKIRTAINDALEHVFWNKEREMVSWLGHNVVRGLVLWAWVHSSRFISSRGSPLEWIEGACFLDSDGEVRCWAKAEDIGVRCECQSPDSWSRTA